MGREGRRTPVAAGHERALALAAAALLWGVPMLAVVLVALIAVLAAAAIAPPLGMLAALLGGGAVSGPLRIVGKRPSGRLTIAPSVAVTAVEEPAIHALVHDASAAVGRPLPDEVRLSFDTLVTLHEHERTLVIGAPWLVGAAPEQLSAAIGRALTDAHPVRVVRLLRRARARLQLAREVAAEGIGAPWRPYVRAGERSLARAEAEHERRVDAALAGALGPAALDAVRSAAELQAGFAAHWAQNVGPCLDAGFAPPVLDGWAQLLEHEADERVALRTPLPRLERELLASAYPHLSRALVDISWDEVGRAVLLPSMRRAVAAHAQALRGWTAGALRDAVLQPPGGISSREWALVVASAVGTLLAEQGWSVVAPLDVPVELRWDEGTAVRPVGLCLGILDGEFDAGTWAELVAIAEIGDRLLAPPGPEAPSASVEPATVVPPGPPALLPLPRTRRSRRRGRLLVPLATLLGVAVLASLSVAATRTPSTGARVIVLGTCALLLVGLVLWTTSRLRGLLGTGALVVDAGGLTIRDPGVLRKPYRVPREAIRAIVIDAQDRSGGRRFPVGPAEYVVPGAQARSAEIGWLWRAGEPGIVPLLGIGDEEPNVAVLFCAPRAAPRRRRLLALDGETATGLLLAVGDADAAREAVAPWDLTRSVSLEDAADLVEDFVGRTDEPEPTAKARSPLASLRRRELIGGWACVAVGLVVPIVALAGAAVGRKWRNTDGGGQLPLIAAGFGVCAVRLMLWATGTL